jgi:hypothetical protein
VDGIEVASSDSSGSHDEADLDDMFYLGGVPDPTAITNPSISPLTSLFGCVRTISLDGTEFDIIDRAMSGTNIGECANDPCSPNPCENGGSCDAIGFLPTDFTCTCPDEVSGELCEETSSPCVGINPCMHGGECRLDSDATTGFICICTATHQGPECEIPVGNTETAYAYAGNSYIAWNVDSDSVADTTLISLRAYPNQDQSSGLLALFINPSLDFLAVILDDGFVKVVMDLGQGVVTVTSSLRIEANTYYTITVNRNGKDIDLTISSMSTVSGRAPGTFAMLNVNNRFYVGGVPMHMTPTLPPALMGIGGFMGCINDVKVNGVFLSSTDLLSSFNARQCSVDLCDPSPCKNGGTCNAVGNSVSCQCPSGFLGPYCDTDDNPCNVVSCAAGATCVPQGSIGICACPLGKGGEQCDEDIVIEKLSFNDNLTSYMAFEPLEDDSRDMTSIYVSIKPLHKDGLIFYTDHGTFSDFLAIGLYDGFVELRYNLGSSTVEIKSATRVELYRWHTIHAQRTGKDGSLTVNDDTPVTGTASGSASQLDNRRDTYLGGHQDYAQVSSDAGLTMGFSGCIDKAKVNTRELNTGTAIRSRGVSDCAGHECDLLHCYNGGSCGHIDALGIYGCICVHGFKGDNCEMTIHNNCTLENDLCHDTAGCVFNYATETYECFCPLVPDPRGGEFCTEINHFQRAKFDGNSFAAYDYPTWTAQTIISFNISSQSTHGLVFYVKGQNVDFLAIGILGGYLELRYDLGTGKVFIRNHVNITSDNHRWHSVTVEREGKLAIFTVDGTAVSDSSPGSAEFLSTQPGIDMYVGGISVMTADLSEYENILDGDFKHGLYGCMADLMVNNQAFDLEMDATGGANVGSCDDY